MTEVMSHGFYAVAGMFNRQNYNGKAIVLTGPPSGYVARMISKYRPFLDVIAFTADIRTARELNLLWGVRTVLNTDLDKIPTFEEKVLKAIETSVSLGLLKLDDHVAVITRSLLGKHVGSITALYNVRKVLDPELRGKSE